MYQHFLVHLVDDGKTKPTPKPDERKTKNKKGKVTKPSSEPTPTVDPDFMCLIRANYRAEKISTVVSFEKIIILMGIESYHRVLVCYTGYTHSPEQHPL